MKRHFERLSGRWIARATACALMLLTPSLAQAFTPASPPAGYVPLSVPVCGPVPQPVHLDLSTTAGPGVDAHWVVVSAPNNYGGPHAFATSDPAWAGNAHAHWVQAAQNAVAQPAAPAGTYVYTMWFNLPCSPSSYSNLHISGSFSADNHGTVYLNGNQLATCTDTTCYWNTIAIPPSTGFVAGLNALSMVVINDPSSPQWNISGGSVIASLDGTCGTICLVDPILKVCKVAGPGADQGSLFAFSAGSGTVTVPAGPAPNGYCAIGPSFPPGTVVTVTEMVLLPNYTVSNIAVAPASHLVSGSLNLALRHVTVAMGTGGVTEVTFTNRKPTGYLEICKKQTAGPFNTAGNASFSVSPGNIGPVVVPVGSCSPALEVAAGPVVITEAAMGSTVVTGCSTLPVVRQGACNTAARTSTVTVVAGDISTQTIAIVTNMQVQTQTTDHPPH